MERFRVLSFDGGGIKGTFAASVAANLEELTGRRLMDHFDLITGTSTGGIIALGLGLGLPARELLDFYLRIGPEIFPSTGPDRFLRALRHPFRPKHSREVLLERLLGVFGERKLCDSKCRLVIPAYDCNAGRIQLFKTAHHERFVRDYNLRAADVAMATAAAPTYFPSFTTPDGQSFLDGGVWANCPVMVGLLEAVFVLGRSPASVDILSIGTTETPFDVSTGRRLGGILRWNRSLVTLLTQAQVDASLAQARLITRDSTLRIDAVTRPGRFSMDDASRVEELRGLGTSRAKGAVNEVFHRFLATPAAPFIPRLSLEEPSTLGKPPFELIARRRRRRSLGVAKGGFLGHEHAIKNISVTGAFLETDREIPVGAQLDLQLELDQDTFVHVTAEVVRVQLPQWGLTSGVGVRFVDYSVDDRQSLEAYVESEGAVLATRLLN